jgi:hypothetical protein
MESPHTHKHFSWNIAQTLVIEVCSNTCHYTLPYSHAQINHTPCMKGPTDVMLTTPLRPIKNPASVLIV